MTWWARLSSRRRDQDLAEEIQGHLDEKIDDLIASGMTPDEAARAARRAFGNVTLTTERGRAVWRWPSIDTWLADVRYACRQLGKRTGFTLVAVLSTALGIGATAAAFSVVYGVLIDPYPYRDISRMVHLHVFDTSGFLFDLPLSSDQFQAFARSPAVEDAMAMDTENMAATGGDFPESVNAGYLSPNAFAFLGVPPLLGRVFTPDDARNPAEPEHVVVLSYPYWQSHYGGQTNIVGRMLSLDHQGYEIVGVMPRRFAWWDGDVYVPLKQSTDPDRLATVFARLRPGVSDRRAEEILGPLIDTMAKDRPGHFPRQFQIRLLHMTDIAAGQLSGAIGAVSVAAGLLLLVGCANVSILLLARGTSKTQELAVRVALGASRGRLMRQLLTESMLISLGGAAAGVLLASPVVDLIPRLLPAGTFPAESVIHVSAPVLLVCAGIAILTGGLFGLWPAVQCSHPELQTIMRAGSRKLTGHPATSRGHNVLITAQVALTLVLLAGAGASGRVFTALLHTTLNYDPRNVTSIRVDLRDGTYPEWHQRVEYYDRIRETVAASPGVASVAVSLSDLPPAVPFHNSAVEIAGRPDEERHAAVVTEISPEYFATLGIALTRGRSWTEPETRRAARVAVINTSMSKRDWPDADPMGQWIRLPDFTAANSWALASPENDGWLQIVGVAADTPNNGLKDPVAPAIYVPYTLVVGDSFRLIARTADPAGAVTATRAQAALARTVADDIHAIDPDQPINQVRTATDVLDAQGWARERFSVSLFSALALLALLLSAAGLYSVVSYVVAERRHDFSVRMALGARRNDVVRLVMIGALDPTATGVAAGLALCLAGSAALARWTQASVRDPYVLVPIVVVLLLVTALAAIIPAYRAASVDPMSGLRAE